AVWFFCLLLIGDGVQPYDPRIPVSLSNYYNSNTKLVNNNTFGPLRVAYFVKERPICSLNFQAKVRSSLVNNVLKAFKTIDSDLQPRLPKIFPIKTSFTQFAGMIQFNGNDTPDVVVKSGFEYYPIDQCDFIKSYLIDPPVQESNNNNNVIVNGQPISYIDSDIMQHDTKSPVPIPPSVFPQYAVTEMSRDQLFGLVYTQYDLDAKNLIYRSNKESSFESTGLYPRNPICETNWKCIINDIANQKRN
ncbi:MAG: hypothetical protein EZS28_014690, partial [Streblomastix strix]